MKIEKAKSKRRYCTHCDRRFNEIKMFYIYVPLVNKRYWICSDCVRSYGMLQPLGIDENGFYPLKIDDCFYDS